MPWLGYVAGLAVACLALAWPQPSLATTPVWAGKTMTGGVYSYRVEAGDTLSSIGARYGVDPHTLMRENSLPENALLRPGQELRVDNRHIVPDVMETGIVINLPQRMLFRVVEGQAEAAYPVAVGRPDWATIEGDFTIINRIEGKTWVVPPSIQEEMAREGEEVRSEVPPGPDNPLGRHWLGLSLPALGIHGTIAPESVYHFQSHGCIRLHPDDAAALYNATNNGDAGKLVYQPVLLYKAQNNKVFLEVHRDVYRKGVDAYRLAQELAASAGATHEIDWQKAAAVIAAQEGIARDVTAVP